MTQHDHYDDDHERPVRAGVFAQVEHAEDAVHKLLDAGIPKDHISVICSDESVKQHFGEIPEHDAIDETNKSRTAEFGIAGGALGAVVSVAGVLTTGGVGIAVIGPILGGAIAGSLIGLFVGRGVEEELARFYDQAVGRGDILVAVTFHEDESGHSESLKRAETILEKEGIKPISLEED